MLGAIFADFAWDVATVVAEGATKFLAFEQPEDLGKRQKGPYRGSRPASMWQWPHLKKLLGQGLRTAAFHQASFGVSYAKPTRLLLKTPVQLPDFVFEGPPVFGPAGDYEGPLRGQRMGAMASRNNAGTFRTTGTEQWPSAMCAWLADLLVTTCVPASTAVGEGTEHTATQEATLKRTRWASATRRKRSP